MNGARLKLGQEVWVHGYIDEIRNGVVIICNDGGYFGTIPREVCEAAGEKPQKEPKPEDTIVPCVGNQKGTVSDCEHCSRIYGTLGCYTTVNNKWVYFCEEGHREYEERQKRIAEFLEQKKGTEE